MLLLLSSVAVSEDKPLYSVLLFFKVLAGGGGGGVCALSFLLLARGFGLKALDQMEYSATHSLLTTHGNEKGFFFL